MKISICAIPSLGIKDFKLEVTDLFPDYGSMSTAQQDCIRAGIRSKVQGILIYLRRPEAVKRSKEGKVAYIMKWWEYVCRTGNWDRSPGAPTMKERMKEVQFYVDYKV